MAIKIPKKTTAKKAKRTPKPKAAKPKAVGPESGYDHVPIADLDVVLLQMKDTGRVNTQDVVFNVFESESNRWKGGAPWMAFHRSDMPHHAGLSMWIGISKSVPPSVLDVIQKVLQATNGELERDMGRPLHLNMNPFARVSGDGLEILVPAALVGDPNARRVIDRGGASPVARGYTILPDKAQGLHQLFFGK